MLVLYVFYKPEPSIYPDHGGSPATLQRLCSCSCLLSNIWALRHIESGGFHSYFKIWTFSLERREKKEALAFTCIPVSGAVKPLGVWRSNAPQGVLILFYTNTLNPTPSGKCECGWWILNPVPPHENSAQVGVTFNIQLLIGQQHQTKYVFYNLNVYQVSDHGGEKVQTVSWRLFKNKTN